MVTVLREHVDNFELLRNKLTNALVQETMPAEIAVDVLINMIANLINDGDLTVQDISARLQDHLDGMGNFSDEIH